LLSQMPQAELIWASPRELLNIFHAESVGCHIITVTNGMLKKLDLIGKNLDDYSLDTVKMFYNDAVLAGYNLKEAIPVRSTRARSTKRGVERIST